mmetsp:Transcript_21126/g.34943  ORF Transcript_21126/g.34943 Transcript_21126/m.34943 type:complete len:159 (-) Transcript_21126:774-1250(-)
MPRVKTSPAETQKTYPMRDVKERNGILATQTQRHTHTRLDTDTHIHTLKIQNLSMSINTTLKYMPIHPSIIYLSTQWKVHAKTCLCVFPGALTHSLLHHQSQILRGEVVSTNEIEDANEIVFQPEPPRPLSGTHGEGNVSRERYQEHLEHWQRVQSRC